MEVRAVDLVKRKLSLEIERLVDAFLLGPLDRFDNFGKRVLSDGGDSVGLVVTSGCPDFWSVYDTFVWR